LITSPVSSVLLSIIDMFRYVKVTSDGVTIVDNKTELTALVINDGPICSGMVLVYYQQ
jgi:hypothetical protein